MKKLLVLLMSLMLIFNLASMAFAVGSNDKTPVYDDDELGNEPQEPTQPQTPTPTTPEATETQAVAVEVKVENTTVGGVELNAEEVVVATVSVADLANEQPLVAATIEESKAAVAEVNNVITSEKATVDEKQAAVTTYFEAKGEAVAAAITAAVTASKEVDKLADITPVVVEPIKIEMQGEAKAAVGALKEGETFQMTIAMPEEFKSYDLKADSFLCAELVDADGNVHIVTFAVVDGKLVGDFPKMGVISNFWIASKNSPKTGSTNLDGVIVCGMLLCAAALLFSVKRIKVQE